MTYHDMPLYEYILSSGEIVNLNGRVRKSCNGLEEEYNVEMKDYVWPIWVREPSEPIMWEGFEVTMRRNHLRRRIEVRMRRS
ncbi:MAG: hypothetical protein BA066_07045 [Candidatus Korarchaeota archaeon NZ13-K]|nr:MAG: hypothetical protein BA066_07045 [Candidatus Korarchaeota archaeon NZ13-K]